MDWNTKKNMKKALFIGKEAEKCVCVCGKTGMKETKIHFDSEVWTRVDVKCNDCGDERTVEMHYPESIYYGE